MNELKQHRYIIGWIMLILLILIIAVCGLAENQAGYTAKSKVNVRTSPDTNSKLVVQIEKKGTEVTVVDLVQGKGSQFYEVYAPNGAHGYIRADLLTGVTPLSEAPAPVPAAEATAVFQLVPYSVAFPRDQKYEVYSGPGKSYVRAANGKATVSTNDWINVFGTENGWALVQYAISGSQYRIGYIQASHLPGGSRVPALTFSYAMRTLQRDASLTDDPDRSQSALKTIRAGETVAMLAQYNDWYYIESGNVRGFVPRLSIEGEPPIAAIPVQAAEPSPEPAPVEIPAEPIPAQASPAQMSEQNETETAAEAPSYEQLKQTVEASDHISAGLNTTVSRIVAPYVDGEGYIASDAETIKNASRAVYQYAEQLKADGIIADCTYSDTSDAVAFFHHDGGMTLYGPNVRETYAGSAEGFTVLAIDSVVSLDDVWATGVSNLFDGNSVWGSVHAAGIIYNGAEEYTGTISSTREDVTYLKLLSFLKSLRENRVRVIIWRGHGLDYELPDGSKELWLSIGQMWDPSDGLLRQAYADGLISEVTDKEGDYGRLGVTTKFFDLVLPDMSEEGCLFLCGSCHSLDDNGKTASLFFRRGFSAYIGAYGSAWTVYSDNMLFSIAENLCKKDADGHYTAIGEAFEAARSENEGYQTSLINFAAFDLKENPALPAFRLTPEHRIRFTVSDRLGTVVDGAWIAVTTDDGVHEAYFSTTGEWKNDQLLLPSGEGGEAQVKVTHARYMDFTETMDLSGNRQVDIVMRLKGKYSGTVVDRDTGEPLRSATVKCVSIQGEIEDRYYELYEEIYMTNDKGAFHFDNLDAGSYRLTVTCPYYLEEETEFILNVDTPSINQKFELQWTDSATIKGTVIDGGMGDILRKVDVAAVDESGVEWHTEVDREGKFKLERLPLGTYRIVCTKGGYTQTSVPTVTLSSPGRVHTMEKAVEMTTDILDKVICGAYLAEIRNYERDICAYEAIDSQDALYRDTPASPLHVGLVDINKDGWNELVFMGINHELRDLTDPIADLDVYTWDRGIARSILYAENVYVEAGNGGWYQIYQPKGTTDVYIDHNNEGARTSVYTQNDEGVYELSISICQMYDYDAEEEAYVYSINDEPVSEARYNVAAKAIAREDTEIISSLWNESDCLLMTFDEAYDLLAHYTYSQESPPPGFIRSGVSPEAYHSEWSSGYQVVTFGAYPQSESGEDHTPIEWLVLEYEEDRALLLSRYGLDAQPYHRELRDITWEQSSVRAWLNGDFLSRAFSAEEQQYVLTTHLSNGGYMTTTRNGGSDTDDKVFLLHDNDGIRYFNLEFWGFSAEENLKVSCRPTPYAIARGAYVPSTSQYGFWWLRSPGSTADEADIVTASGLAKDAAVNGTDCLIRPAVWVGLHDGLLGD